MTSRVGIPGISSVDVATQIAAAAEAAAIAAAATDATTKANAAQAAATADAATKYVRVVDEVASATDPQWGIPTNGTNGAAELTAFFAAVAAAKGSGYLPPATYTYTSVVPVPSNVILRGGGYGTVLQGPGLSHLNTANSYTGDRVSISDVLLDGSSYVASGRGLNILGSNFIELQRVKFLGFKDQIVADQVQRLRLSLTEHVANTGTRSGLWIPYGPDAHTGVVAATASTNLVEVNGSHFNWFNASAGYPIADDGGLQHIFDAVQCSYGAASIRLGQPSGVTLRACDLEFCAGTDTILSATTSLTGTALTDKTVQLTVGPGNYFDKQVNLTNVDSLVDIGNDFHIPSLPVYRNTSSATAVFSIGSGNVSSGGSMFDGNPSGSSYIVGRTNIATLRQTLLAFGFRANSSSATAPQMWVSTLPLSTPAYGSNRGYGIGSDGKAIVNADGLRSQIAGVDSVTMDDGAGRGSWAPRQVTVVAFATPAGSLAASGTWTAIYTTNGGWFGGILTQSAAAQNDYVEYDALLPVGTWTLDLFHRADTNVGIYSITVDGTALATLGGSSSTIDGYSASVTGTRSTVTGIVLPVSSAPRRVQLTLATKNASSSGYAGKLSALVFTRTA